MKPTELFKSPITKYNKYLLVPVKSIRNSDRIIYIGLILKSLQQIAWLIRQCKGVGDSVRYFT